MEKYKPIVTLFLDKRVKKSQVNFPLSSRSTVSLIKKDIIQILTFRLRNGKK